MQPTVEPTMQPTVEERQKNTLNWYATHCKEIIPVEQQTKYCLLYQKEVLFSFDTFEEARTKQKSLPLVCTLFSPNDSRTKT